MRTIHYPRGAGKTAELVAELKAVAHRADLEMLKLDLAIYGMAMVDENGRRVPPVLPGGGR